MDWPHDPDGEQGSEGMRKFGHAVVAKKINEEEDFPLETAEFVDEYGHHPVRIDHERVVPLEALFESVDESEFKNFVEFHQAVGEAMRADGYWSYEGPEKFA